MDSILKKLFMIIYFIIPAVIIHGCASIPDGKPHFIVEINTLGESNPTKNKFILLPADESITMNDLQFQEFHKTTILTLEDTGFIHTNDPDLADIALFISYGIGEPKEYVYSYSVPTWGQTGVMASNTSGTFTNYGGFGDFTARTSYTPTYGITGSQTRTSAYTLYKRHIILEALDIKELTLNNINKPIWKTEIISEGSSDDLRHVFPYMITSSKNHIGRNTGRKIDNIIYEDDIRVLNLLNLAR